MLKNDENTLIKTYRNKGISLTQLERYDEAIECFQLALLIDPSDYKSLLNKAVALDELGHHEEAIKIYDLIIAHLTVIEDPIEELNILIPDLN